MRIALKIGYIATGVLLAITFFFQVLALLAATNPAALTGNPDIDYNLSFYEQRPWLVPLWIAGLCLLAIAYILTPVMKRRGWWSVAPLAAAVVGAVFIFMVTAALGAHFVPQVGQDGTATGTTFGLTTERLFFRHYASALLGLVVAAFAGWHLYGHLAACRRAKQAEEDAFTGSTIGLEEEEALPSTLTAATKKEKRSVRAAREKGKRP